MSTLHTLFFPKGPNRNTNYSPSSSWIRVEMMSMGVLWSMLNILKGL